MTTVPPSTVGGATVALFPRRLKHNPYPELLADALANEDVCAVEGKDAPGWYWRQRRSVQALHFNWLHAHYRHWRGGIFNWVTAVAFVLRMLSARAMGYRLYWTIHNDQPHDTAQALLDRLMRSFMLGMAHPVVHCAHARDILARQLGPTVLDAIIIPHGEFGPAYPPAVDPTAARAELGVEPSAEVVLFLGQIRPYKGIEELLDAWPGVLARRPRAQLWVAGLGDPSRPQWVEAIRSRVRGLDRAHWVEGFVPSDEVPTLLSACDILALPYRRILVSGSAILGWSFSRAAVAPMVGCFSGDQEDDALYLYPSGSRSGLVEALARGLATPPSRREAAARRRADACCWKQAAARLANAYREGAG